MRETDAAGLSVETEADEERAALIYTQREEDGALESSLILTQSCPHTTYTTMEEWSLQPHSSLNDSESEDVLQAINPNEVYSSAPSRLSLSESDSGMSDDRSTDAPTLLIDPVHTQATPTVYQVVYDISGLGGASQEHQKVDLISIELDEWSSQVLMSESCVVSELPLVNVEHTHPESFQNSPNTHVEGLHVYPDLNLTEEEQKLLNQEGVSLPNNLPLTKAEERILKKVRRKIRNKQSAQDSRKRRKEYIDGLESRVAACSTQNKELQRTVDQLEKHNMSLLTQLRKLQTLVKQTATKAAQTSTCLMILVFSLALIILPSYCPFSWSSQSSRSTYVPTGVISRNILNDADTAVNPSDAAVEIRDAPDSQSLTADVQQTEPGQEDPPPVPHAQPRAEGGEMLGTDSEVQGNSSATADHHAEAPSELQAPPAGAGSVDTTKPAHADEM